MNFFKFEKVKNVSKIHNVFTLFGIRFKFFLGIANSLYVNKYLHGIKPYKSSSHKIWDVAPEERKNILKLDWNEASVPPSPKVMQRIQELLKEDNFLNLYPKTYNSSLMELLSKYVCLPKENIQYFSSSDAIHEYIAKLYIKENDKVLIQGPSYDNFRLTAEANGAKVYYSEVDGKSYSLNESIFKADIEKVDPSFVYICSPNNPCGFINKTEYIELLLKEFPGVMFLIDEAYEEFSKISAKNLVLKYDNILITRTMSKAFALANLRFGYLLASKENVLSITSIRNPKNIGTFTQEAAIAALSDIDYMENYVKEVNSAKEYFYENIKKHKEIKTFPSCANFVLMEFENFGIKTRLFNFLQQKNIFVRELVQSPLLYKCLRITIGTVSQMKYVLDVIDQFFEQENEETVKVQEKIAFFDFCETIANFQTGDAFIRYVLNKEQAYSFNFYTYLRLTLIKLKSKLIKNYSCKLPLLSLLKGLSYEKLDNYALSFYVEKVRNNFIPEVVEELKRIVSDGYRVYLISGGYDLYLKYFIDEFKLDGYFSTKIKFENGLCLGCFDGLDCMNSNKIKYIENFFSKENIENYHTIAYSDSPSDIPLLKYVKEAVVVTPKEKSWADNFNFKKLIYKCKH